MHELQARRARRTREIVQRRNKVLDLMKTRSPLTGSKHTPAEYEAAKEEPVELVPQVAADWKAPHFVWQVRRAARRDALPGQPERLPRGRHRRLQGHHHARLEACRRSPRSGSTSRPAHRTPRTRRRSWPAARSPRPARSWILGLRGHNINNAAAGGRSTTGPARSSPTSGSASYTSKGNKKFQPQFDVLADGWRQPGSAIKPIDYAIGIDDKTLTAATMFMDVTTNFGGGFIPIQADKLERGPVRLRSALQFSLNIPAIKATIMSGLDHIFDRTKDFGLTYPKTAVPVLSMGIGTLEVHPIDLLGAYGTIANGGVTMPRRVISTILDDDGTADLAAADENAPTGTRVISAAGGLHHHRHPGRQHRHEGQPVLGQVGDLRRQDPPTGRLQDRHDQRQQGRGGLRLTSPRRRTRRRRPRGRGLDGQQRQHARTTASSRSTPPRRCGRRS